MIILDFLTVNNELVKMAVLQLITYLAIATSKVYAYLLLSHTKLFLALYNYQTFVPIDMTLYIFPD